jgi:hypothetical protein
MFWYGLIIGFTIGVCLVTLAYGPLVVRVEKAEAIMRHHRKLVAELKAQLDQSEIKYRELHSDFQVLQAIAPKDIYAKFFEAPYKN